MVNGTIGYFIKALVLDKTGYQRFKITDRGLSFLKDRPEKITIEELRKFKEFDEFIQRRYNKVDKAIPDMATESIPEDIIDSAYQIHKENLAVELLDKIKQGTWQFFEMLVKDLLVSLLTSKNMCGG